MRADDDDSTGSVRLAGCLVLLVVALLSAALGGAGVAVALAAIAGGQ